MARVSVEEIVRDTYAVHFVLSGFGIDADEIYVGAQAISNAEEPGVHATVSVKRGGKTWLMWLHPLRSLGEVRQFEQAWHAFIARRRTLGQDELDGFIAPSPALLQVEPIRQGLIGKGILPSN